MLPAPNRMRRSSEFTTAVRRGSRAGGGVLVVHHRPGDPSLSGTPPRIGLVISRAVGSSVVRHRVARRLRAQLRPRLGAFAPGSLTVVRALPAASTSSSIRLGRALDQALRRLGLPAGAS